MGLGRGLRYEYAGPSELAGLEQLHVEYGTGIFGHHYRQRLLLAFYSISATGSSSSDHNRQVAALNSDQCRQLGSSIPSKS